MILQPVGELRVVTFARRLKRNQHYVADARALQPRAGSSAGGSSGAAAALASNAARAPTMWNFCPSSRRKHLHSREVITRTSAKPAALALRSSS